ncbi:DUF3581 domain-containing protein [Shewanella sp. 202IG2-18]|uniref:DUF3581 domain-containing protein n=1 Tax=Parashewanella hymeniacidonis TaxID=2807618 RepID=UPI00195FBD2C|nr:DUF3581 domain-containing protein [Parashewanella hymeniacidonis]MBM7073860.1 DUF3581 domain-containing protein [Parashewanella hymeniacidonis]
MFLAPFFEKQGSTIKVSSQQASDFAKNIAGDLNPIHDVDAKRFCVPGDLLFALVLNQYGLSQSMEFNFAGMVGDGVELHFPEAASEFAITDTKDKTYLTVKRDGAIDDNQKQIEAFIRSYVAFSGLNFMHVLVPMMKEHQVMINPARPLVIYESMAFELSSFDFDDIELKLVKTELEVQGKRGDVTLNFELMSHGHMVGTGTKSLVMSGLRPYEAEGVQSMCDLYEQRQLQYKQAS